MKNGMISILFVILFSACGNEGNAKKTVKNSAAVSRKVNWGELVINLPKIEGTTECYQEDNVKAYADQFEIAENQILAFYLNNESYKKRELLGKLVFDDYFKIYATTSMKDLRAENEELDEIVRLIKSGYITKNWDDINDKFLNTGIEIGQPVLIDDYRLQENSYSLIMLSKYVVDNKATNACIAINALLIKNRLIWMAYYLKYNNKQTIEKLKSKNNKIITKILSVN